VMDSVLEEDVTHPGTPSGCSGLVSSVPDDLGGVNANAGLRNGALPEVSEEMVSPTRARNMKDFENQITELKKENFNLKLRIYFLEERMQQEFDGPTEHIYKTNIELKVEVESLKRELQEREQLLIKASKAVESLAEGGGSDIQQVKEDARKKVKQVEEVLNKRIVLLEEDVKAAQAELEKAFAGTETEKALRLSLESKLSEMKEMHAGDLEMVLVLEEKDRLIEELKLSLKSKEALIQCLKEEKSQMASPDENVSSGELRGLSAALREEKEKETEAAQTERQKERSHYEGRIQALQQDLREKEREIATEKKNSLKRDKAIQGLTMALKSKEKEVEELNSEIEELSAAFAKAREAAQKAQTQEFQGSKDYEAALSGKEALLAELRSENHSKSTENHRLRRNIKKVTQELSDLQQERERLEKDLKEAHRERSKGDCIIRDLRNEVEKLHNEVNEKEKAVENRYKSLLNESNQKLQSQEQLIKHLTESVNQKDLLLQKFSEKDLEVIQQNCYLMTAEDPEFRSKGLITEKCSSQQLPGSKVIFSEEKQQSDYEELIQVLKKERDIYTHLVKSLQDSDSINNLQAELNSIFALRKQLEQDVLSYRNLQKTLEEQISEIRRREEPFSFYSDQTSYLSICLEEHNQFQVEHFSQEELKKKVSELIQLVKELYTDNQHLKKTIFDFSCGGFQGNGRLESAGRTEDAKKSRLPILVKPSRSLGSAYYLPGTQEVVAQLQGQILKLQGELKEFKTRNKQLHRKLILAEALMEGRPTSDTTLLNAQPLVGEANQDSPEEHKGVKTTPSVGRAKEMDNDQQTSCEIDSEIYPSDDLAILPACKENPEDCLGLTSVATYMSSKSQPSIKVSMIGTDQCEDINTSNDTECLKQKIHDLETELEGYRNFIFQLQKHSQCSEAIITVLCGTEGAQDGLGKPKVSTDEEEMTFSRLRQVRYVKHTKILHPLAPEMIDGGMLESLQQQLVEQEYELQKEQNLNMELFSEIHNLQNKFRDLSPSRYNSLVQSQARELSLQRQQIKDSHGICVIYRQHMDTMIKAFEELLQASDVDYCVAQGFQEQLNQCAELLGKLEKLFLNGKSGGVEMSTENELMERIEEDNLTYQHILPESPEPSASHALSDNETSEKSFFSREQKQDSETEKTSVVANKFSQDLLMEHIQEIRTLRKRLEESIKTNEKLRKQLERQESEFDQGSTNICASGSELHNSLTSEIHFLRKQNQALNTMLMKGSRDKQKENEKLRESLSRKTASLEHLQQEYASVREENERLQKEVSEKERHNQQLIQEVCSTGKELSRVQEEMRLRQQQLSQNDKLLQSLRVELKVYEKLDEEHKRLREARAEASGEGWKGQDPFGDLHGLLTEIQALRAQLERSIETNSILKSKLEEQLAQGAEKAQEGALTLAVQALAIPQRPCQLGTLDGDKCPTASENSLDLFDSTQAVTPKSASETPLLSGNDVDSLSCDSISSATSTPSVSHLVTDHRLWASKSGHHVLGLIEDFEALCTQVGQGQRLLAEMDMQTQEALGPAREELATKGPHLAPLSKFATSVSTAKLTLEEASKLLKHLWRVSLPTDGQCGLHCEQIEEMKAEITKLHKKLFELEKKLQNTVQLLELSRHQEKVIFDQLVVTHKILRKARGNLELRPGGAHPGTSSPSRPGS
uniref:CDK5 regulatory subunit-associated protein 2 n=1 Tax=Microcebus murinus TaxID=30608 RepID=A0A8C5VU46_MICMU